MSKRSFANKLLTKKEISSHVNPYDGKVWEESKRQKSEAVMMRIEKAEVRREEIRKEKQKKHNEFLNSHKK
jgi:hypothetical protein